MHLSIKHLVVAFILSIIPTLARADIYRQIDLCQSSSGANNCIYDLLRNFASRSGGPVAPNSQIFCSCESTSNVHECYVYQTAQESGGRYFLDVPDYDLVFKNINTGSELARRRIDCTTHDGFKPEYSCEQTIASDPRCH